MIFYTSRGPNKNNCMFGTVQMSCTYNCMCASPPYIYIYISCIKYNVVTLYERVLTCFIIYRNAILGEGEKEGEGGVETKQ